MSVAAALLDIERPQARKAPAPETSPATVDSRVVALFDNVALRNQVRKLDKVELASVRTLTLQALPRLASAKPLNRLQVHQRMIDGLPGEALLVASALFLNTLADVERYFGLSFKTIKARLGGSLDSATSERALRAARTTLTAADVLGSFDAARDYMHTRNFALGGATPADLAKTADGERIALNELQAHAEGGPL